MQSMRRRYWIEVGLATLSTVFTILTLLWKDWIEIVFRVDPDHHSGSLEWAIAAAFLVVAITSSAMARREWRRRPGLAA